MSVHRSEVVAFLDTLLKPNEIKDYCPNGLQVEGKETIRRLVTGVTASKALIEAAIEHRADAILVHHGYFWKGENPTITGMKANRIRQLLGHDINLLAYHLPIDVHPSLGNNVQLGERLGLSTIAPLTFVSPQGIVFQGESAEPMSGALLKSRLEAVLQRHILHEGNSEGNIHRIAWCTGGGQGYIEQAADAGMDAFITGEVSEQTIHIARERGIHFYAAGHHATERYGVKAVGEYLSQHLPVDVNFIDIDNPA